MANDLWTSARLIYRGADKEDEEGILIDINKDATSFLNAAPLIPTPRSKQTAVAFREYLQSPKLLLAAIICLPAAEEKEEQAKGSLIDPNGTNNKEKEQDKKPPSPIPIGMITLGSEEPPFIHHRRAELGIHLLPKYHNQGYGTEAILWALRWGFNRANLHRVGIGHFSFNEGAGRLYQKLGFKPEARRRDFFWHDGAYHDAVELAMLENEWRELYNKKS